MRADHFKSHHLEELVEVDGAGSILVNFSNHLFNFLLLGLKTKSHMATFNSLASMAPEPLVSNR